MQTKIVLQPYKIRETKLVIKDEVPLTLTWEELKKLLAPSNTKTALLLLRKIKISSFVGLLKKQNGTLTNFLYVPNDTKEKIAPLVKQLPDVITRLDSLYKVISVDFGSRFKE